MSGAARDRDRPRSGTRGGGGQDTFRPLGQPEALPERTPFTACHGLATDRQLCTDVHARFAVRQ